VITRRRVGWLPASGFRADTVEKVLRLCAILQAARSSPDDRHRWLLRGTALNLLYTLTCRGCQWTSI
jgi:hypothetical protein